MWLLPEKRGYSLLKSIPLFLLGDVYSWGVGSLQLGQEEKETEDLWEPTLLEGEQLAGRRVVAVSARGQHTVLLTTKK